MSRLGSIIAATAALAMLAPTGTGSESANRTYSKMQLPRKEWEKRKKKTRRQKESRKANRS